MAKAAAAVARKILATKTSQLPVYLTDEEIRELGKRLARHEGELAAHKQKAQDIRDDLKAKESAIASQIHLVSSIVNQTYEYRPVSVRVEADYGVGKVFEIREDTGEVVAERAVNEQDRQASIFDLKPATTKNGAQKTTPSTFVWQDGPDCSVALVQGGKYEIDDRADGRALLRWCPEVGSKVNAGNFESREAAKKEAEQHLLERTGDEILKNAGSGELAKKELKGEAVARKQSKK